MTRSLLPSALLVAALAAACSSTTPDPKDDAVPEPGPTPIALDPRAVARAQNDAAYHRDGARLAAEAPGQWVLIVHGATHGPWASFDDAWRAAEDQAAGAAQAYLYRAGVDDVDVTFALSPFLSSDPNWTQMGRRMQRPLKFTIAAANDTWSRRVDGEVLSATWGNARARFVLRSPDRGTEFVTRGGASGLFTDDLSITEDAAERLGLDVFEAPGVAYYADERWPCRKALVHLAIPELGVDVPGIAYVLPRDLTEPIGWSGPERGHRLEDLIDPQVQDQEEEEAEAADAAASARVGAEPVVEIVDSVLEAR
ncbi:MAG: hypothetical protein AAGB93_25725 [Planctomycetota bacterium]